MIEISEAVAVAEATQADQGRCTMLFVQTAAKKHRFLSSQPKAGQYTAKNAIRNTKNNTEFFVL